MSETGSTLAYGYDLTDAPRFTDGARPTWWPVGDDLFDSFDDRLRAIHRASGRPDRSGPEDPIRNWIGDVVFEPWITGSQERLVLAAHVVDSGIGQAEPPGPPTVPDGADAALAWAVNALGLDVRDTPAAWYRLAWGE